MDLQLLRVVQLAPRRGVEARFVDTLDYDAYAEAIDDDTAYVHVETIGNPALVTPDLARLADVEGDDFTRFLTRPDTALLAAVTARRHGIEPGDPIRLRIAGEPRAVTVIGLIESGRRAEAAVDGLMAVEIGRRRVGKECRSRWSPYH